MKKIFYVLLLLSVLANGQIIIDHRHVQMYDDIPQRWIDSVKTKWLSYAGESHSEAIRAGLEDLEDSNAVYQVNITESGTPEGATESYLRCSRATWGDVDNSSGWIYGYGEEDWFTSQTARDRTVNGLIYCNENGYELDYFAFGWCYDAGYPHDQFSTFYDTVYAVRWCGESVGGPEGSTVWGLDYTDTANCENTVTMNMYLAATKRYVDSCESKGYSTKVIFTTGTVDNEYSTADEEAGYQQYLKWEHIRNYVDTASGNYILFDYADILAYNYAGTQATTTFTDSTSTLQTYPIIHTENTQGGYVAHIGHNGAIKIAKALWVLMAIDAGWDTSAMDTTKWYISNTGNDSYNGHYQDSALATMSELESRGIWHGDSILFECGGVWREQFNLTTAIQNSTTDYVVFSSYGSGRRPLLLGSERVPSWTAQGTENIWRSNITFDDEFDDSDPQNYYGLATLYFCKDDSVTTAWPYKTYDVGFTNLTQEYDFTTNNDTIYIYSPTDPDTRYDSVEAGQRNHIFMCTDASPVSYITWENINIRFVDESGFNFGYPEQSGQSNLIFKNDSIQYIGVRGGNAAYGIELFHSNSLVENCYFTDCGRRAVSLNLYEDDPQVTVRNVIIRDNTFKRGFHTTAVDISCQNTGSDTIENIYFYNNIVDDHEHDTTLSSGWTSNQVFVQNGDSIAKVNNIYVVGNLFVFATARNILYEGSDTSYTYNNTIIGFNPSIFYDDNLSPYKNVGYNGGPLHNAWYANNILYDNLGEINHQNHGVAAFVEYGDTVIFHQKDYNLYYQTNPGYVVDRNFTAHPTNSEQENGTSYYNIDQWSSYLSDNADSAYDANSPTPQLPDFVDYDNFNFHITDSSVADSAGIVLSYIIITDPFGVVDTINKYDLDGLELSRTYPPIGAYATAGESQEQAFIYKNSSTSKGYILINGQTKLIRRRFE